MSPSKTIYAKSEWFHSRAIGDGIVLIPVGGRGGTPDAVYALNPTGARVWRSLDGATTVEEITQEIGREFGTTIEKAREDVAAFLEELSAIHAVRPVAQG